MVGAKRLAFVDPERVFLFGHSMGGVMGPMLAGTERVHGVAVFGTAFGSWLAYELENTRRQQIMHGLPYEEVDAGMRDRELFLTQLYVLGRPMDEILKAQPRLRSIAGAKDDVHLYSGKHYKFFQQLYGLELAAIWKKVDCSVLSLHGASDFVSFAHDHERLADAVNRKRKGRARYVQIRKMDHWFRGAATPMDSLKGRVSTDFDPKIVDVLHAWLKRAL